MGLLDASERENARDLAGLLRLLHSKRGDGVGGAALCLSGGGIRSATFNLGVLQGLAKRKLLPQFHYLSTVSGGGYIGSWLSAWIHRENGDVESVQDRLAARSRQERSAGDATDPIDHLRRHAKYLSPRLGLLSADTWALVSIYTRNLILNWLIILPLLMAVLMLPRLFVSLEQVLALHGDDRALGWSWRGWLGLAGLGLVGASFVFASRNQPSATAVAPDRDADGKRARAAEQRFLLLCLTPLLLGAIAATLAWACDACVTAKPDFAVWRQFATYGAVLGSVSGLMAWFRRSSDPRGLIELVFVAIAGVVAASTLWVAALAFFHVAAWLTSIGCGASWWHLLYVALGVPSVLMALSAGGTVYIGLCSRQTWATDSDREWWARYGAWILIATLAWLLASVVVILLPSGLQWLGDQMPKVATFVATSGGLAGIATAVLGFSADTPGTNDGHAPPKGARWKAPALKLAGPLFLLLLLCGLVLSADGLLRALGLASGAAHSELLLDSSFWAAAVMLGLIGAAVLLALAIHLNRFTLHAIYRDRLIRAYLGASHHDRRPHPFTGFDPTDNLWLHAMRPALRRRTDTASPKEFLVPLQQATNEVATQLKNALRKPVREALNRVTADPSRSGATPSAAADNRRLVTDIVTDLARCGLYREATMNQALGPDAKAADDQPPPLRLLHVVNMALNMVRTDNMAWHERKADSFTSTMFHTGNARLGYRDSARYAGKDGITLGTAMSISGAAVSPNMGYQSSPLMAFLLTLLNVRLGAWFGNPGKAGDATHEREAPRLGLLTLLWEAFGRTTDHHGYVYLSDGGHFENLGLYEMVRRRCGFIVVCDAGQDSTCRFEDLGNAIRKVRIDFGIPILFDDMRIQARGADGKGAGAHFAVGTIDYAAVDAGAQPGKLLVLKASLTGDEPRDVLDYADRVPQFPHESTAHQFFSEAQFESYRALGEHIVEKLPDGETLAALRAKLWLGDQATVGQSQPNTAPVAKP